MQQASSLYSFKQTLSRDSRQIVPNYYYLGSRKLQVLHTRLRTECSSLNAQLYAKNIVHSPLCICGSNETCTHYFFVCRMFSTQRESLLSVLRDLSIHVPINTKLLLFGSCNLTDDQNATIFKAVYKYIEGTKRF